MVQVNRNSVKLIVAAIAATLPQLAHADLDAGLILEAISNAATSTYQRIVSSIGSDVGRLGGMIDAQTSRQVDANAQNTRQVMKNQADVSEVQSERENETNYQLPEDPCKTGEVANYVEGMHAAYQSVAAKYKVGGSSRGSYVYSDKGMNAVMNESPSPGVAATQLQDLHGRRYCSQDDFEKYGQQVCAGGVSTTPGADTDADTMFAGTNPESHPTLSFAQTGRDVEAANLYSESVIYGIKPQKLQEPYTANTPAGRAYIALFNAYHARMSLAHKGFRETIAFRTALGGDTPKLAAAIFNGTNASDMEKKYYEEHKTDFDKNGISLAELYDFEIKSRYMNPNWVNNLGAIEPPAMQRETLLMQALALSLQWEQFKKLEYIATVLGAINGSQVRQDLEPKLNAQFAEATSKGHGQLLGGR